MPDPTILVRYARSPLNASSTAGSPAVNIDFNKVRIAAGHRIPASGEKVRIELATQFNKGVINHDSETFEEFRDNLLATPGRGAAQAVKVVSITSATPVAGYPRIVVRPISSNNTADNITDVRVMNMNVNITNVIPSGQVGILATDARDNLNYYLTNAIPFRLD